MIELLQTLANQIAGQTPCKASIVTTSIPKVHGNWRRHTLQLTSTDGSFSRPLLTVVSPPARWPVTVEYHHADPTLTTGYSHEWGRDPNIVHPDNPPTIDNEAELSKVLAGLMALPETTKSLAAFS